MSTGTSFQPRTCDCSFAPYRHVVETKAAWNRHLAKQRQDAAENIPADVMLPPPQPQYLKAVEVEEEEPQEYLVATEPDSAKVRRIWEERVRRCEGTFFFFLGCIWEDRFRESLRVDLFPFLTSSKQEGFYGCCRRRSCGLYLDLTTWFHFFSLSFLFLASKCPLTYCFFSFLCFFFHVLAGSRELSKREECRLLVDAASTSVVSTLWCRPCGLGLVVSTLWCRPCGLGLVGLGLGGCGLGGLGGLGLSGLDPQRRSPPSVHIALCLLCFLVFSSSRQSTSFLFSNI
jgi:hypothetical protein